MAVFGSYKVSDQDIAKRLGFPEDADEWSCAQWKIYYLKLKERYGRNRALQIFEGDVGGAGFFADVNNCKYDCAFVNYFRSEGLDGGNIFSKLYCAANSVAGAVGNAAGVVENVAQTTNKLTSPGLLIAAGIVALIIYTSKKK